MKKLLLVVVFVVFGIINVNAQTSFGIKAGANAAFLTGDVPSGTINYGINAGVVAEFQLSDKWALQPGAIFAMQGAKTDHTVELISHSISKLPKKARKAIKSAVKGTEYTVSLYYINVPIIAKYYITDNFNIQLGPQIGFLVSADGEAEPNFNIPASKKVETKLRNELVGDIKDYYNNIYIGLKAGAGYKLDNGLFFNLYYNMGLTDIKKGQKTIRNAGIQLSVGYMF